MGRQSQLPLRKYFYPNKRSSENLKAKLHSLKMEHILDETVPAEDLKRFEQKYHEELQHGKVSHPNDTLFSLLNYNFYLFFRLVPALSLSTPGAWSGPGTQLTSGRESSCWRTYSRWVLCYCTW